MNNVLEWLEHYKHNNSIEGWLSEGAIDFLKLIYKIIGETEVYGGALEIGVHHGKFFIPLHAIVSPAATSVAVDLFDDQYLNIDYSGKGNKEVFKANFDKYRCHNESELKILAADSIDTKPNQILELSGNVPFTVVSVDGGHTAEHTISDLKLASAVVSKFGFVILDDILNLEWLGVIDGTLEYLKTRPTLWPLAIGHNKLIFCSMSIYPIYKEQFSQLFSFRKTTNLCGYNILVAI